MANLKSIEGIKSFEDEQISTIVLTEKELAKRIADLQKEYEDRIKEEKKRLDAERE